MKAKVESILKCLSKLEGTKGIRSFRMLGDQAYMLETELSDLGHRTLLTYEAAGDEYVRLRIAHVFGTFQTSLKSAEDAAKQLFAILRANGDSLDGAPLTGCLVDDGEYYATINNTHYIHAKWKDEEIAEVIALHLFDIMMNMVTEDPSITIIKRAES